MDLLLVRHARPVRVEAETGVADPPLTDEGEEQARRLAAWLASEHIDFVYSSPLQRAQQTAEPLAVEGGHDVVIENGLAEFDAEASSYIPMEELRREPGMLSALVEGRWEELGNMAEPEAFRSGVIETVERIIADNPKRRVAVVCHGAVINVYLGHVIGTPKLLWFEPAYASISRVIASSTGIRTVVSVNETAHLR